MPKALHPPAPGSPAADDLGEYAAPVERRKKALPILAPARAWQITPLLYDNGITI
jgi:hypothetical protein